MILLALLLLSGVAALNPLQWKYSACTYATAIAVFSATAVFWKTLLGKITTPTIIIGAVLVIVALVKAVRRILKEQENDNS